ncbi:MAG TPA: GGDEF domain-containing protein [Candidatus Limnocylindrales bacterium]|nr:GGDEF domain-containing protein [Candidatus Limnocylindrales bacterium]
MEDPRIHRSWLAFTGAFVLLGLVAAARLWFVTGLSDWLVAILVVAAGTAAFRHRSAVRDLESGRRAEAESFARILQGLSRSVSPDAILGAIVEELGSGTDADHIVIVRRRPDARVLEATLVNARSGGSTSSTLFPIGDLEDAPEPVVTRVAVPIPIEAGAVTSAGTGIPPAVGPDLGTAPLGPDLSTIALGTASGTAHRSGRRMPAVGPAPGLVQGDGRQPLRSRRAQPGEAGRSDDAGQVAGRAGRAFDPDRLVAERIARRARAVFGLRNTLVVPLTTDRGMIGALLISRRTAGPWPAAAQRLLAGASVEASAALSRAYSHRQAEERASTDGLTGLPNRRYFDEFCALLARRRRAEDSVGVLMVDIDKFKALNDRHGHPVGDEVLRAVAGAIVGAVREDDVPARYGGEEFAVLLRNPTPAVAVEVGERVRAAVGALDLTRHGVPGVSVSVGAAVATDPDEPITRTIEQADRALYEAKRAGRDRVVAA